MTIDGHMLDSDVDLSSLQLSVLPTAALSESVKIEIVDLCTRAFDEDFSELFPLVAGAVAPMHVLARLNGKLVSHAMWSERPLFLADGTTVVSAYLDAVATDPAYQDIGLGSVVINRLQHEIRGFAIGCLSTNRPNFYARLGWEIWTGAKAVRTAHGIEPTPDDIVMIYRTACSPEIDIGSLLLANARRSGNW
ncbi:MAG TPA: GNAT family N-acetyltransferase [Nitrolancea sp.]|nr:GNAT family N-acetyltransferase [Nitrolancea sp.]